MTSSIGEADVSRTRSHGCIRQMRKIYHPHWLYILQYSFDLLCLQICSCNLTYSPYIIHPSHSFSNVSIAHHISFTDTFHFQIPFRQAHIVVLIRHKSRPRSIFPAHCRYRNTKTRFTHMRINDTDRVTDTRNVFPPLYIRLHLTRNLVIFSNHTYKSTCYNAWLMRHLTTTLRT